LVIDEANNPLSEALIESIRNTNNYNVSLDDYDSGVEDLSEGKYSAAIYIEGDFTDAGYETGESLKIIALKDDVEIRTLKNNLMGLLANHHQRSKVMKLGEDIFKEIPTVNIDKVKNDMSESFEQQWLYRKPMDIQTVSGNMENRRNNNVKGQIIGFAILFSAYTMVFGVGQIVTDKEDKTYFRMMTSPLSKISILMGYTIIPMLSGIIQLSVIFVAGRFLFDLNWGGNILDILLVIIAFVFSLTAIGLLLSTFVKTSGQLSAFTPIILTSFAMLGGCMWPLEVVTSKILLLLANITPHKWAVLGLTDIAIKNGSFMNSMDSILILLGMGVCVYAIGLFRLRKDATI
ncbi:MAG: ABC transporter permease, partial [Clostridia bacterium]|nr:ABC transporter permease [Clostridia bacterium]